MKDHHGVFDSQNNKFVRTPDYNFNFDKKSGFFARWGKTEDDDPVMSPLGNEILDIEVTEVCRGPKGKPCPFCYKSNGPNHGRVMTLDQFKTIIDKMPKIITQVAIGADAQAESNPDLFAMADYARSKGIIPNITVADISDEVADKLAKVMGAVAVSRYEDKNVCYDSIQKLVNRGMKQVNMHIMVSVETYDWVKETINDYHDDERLKGLNAIVFLSLKQKGRGESFKGISQEQFTDLVNLALSKKVPFGFDSCSANKFLKSVQGHKNFKSMEMMAEPCESTLFSAYINAAGAFFPCSFAEGNDDWKEGINVLEVNDFVKDVWENPRVKEFRSKLICNGRNCPMFNV